MNESETWIRDTVKGLVSAQNKFEKRVWRDRLHMHCNLAAITKLLAELDAAREDAESLRAFAQAIMGDWPDVGGLDGGDLQELSVKHGLLVGIMKAVPCRKENCYCAGYGYFPMECFTKTPLLSGPDTDAQPGANK